MSKPKRQPVVSHRVDLALEDTNGDERADDRYLVVVAAPPVREDTGEAYMLAGLVLGAALGAVVGLFLAPRSGDETRRQVLGRLPGNVGDTFADVQRQIRQRLPGQAADTAAEPGAAGSDAAPVNAPPGALDPVAQVTQYEAPPVRTDAPAPYHADTEPTPPSPPSPAS
jgi:hypothetical protein